MEIGLDLVAILVGTAFIAGMLDAIAGGGGLITIPALMMTGISPISALATGKFQATFGTAGAVVAFYRKGRIDLRRFALPTVAAFFGSALGAFLLTRINPSFVEACVPVMLIAMAAYFLFAPRMSDQDRHSKAGPLLLFGTAMVIGCYDGLFGPGTGSFFTTALVALFGLGLLGAVAHAKLLNLASNIAALMVFIAGGHVLWFLGTCMAVASIAGGQVGAHATIRFGAKAARPLLIVICLALTAKLLSEPGNPLLGIARSWLT